jgi:hypothetical protein
MKGSYVDQYWEAKVTAPVTRVGVQVDGERNLLNETWAQVEQTLGWRPVPAPKRGGR